MFQRPRTTFVLYSALELATKLVSICSPSPLKQLLLPDYDLYIDRVNFSYPRIPLPELKDSDKLDKIMNMKEATKKIRLGPENLPSICFYSFLNAYQVSHAWIWILNVWMTTLLVFKYNLISMLTKPYSCFCDELSVINVKLLKHHYLILWIKLLFTVLPQNNAVTYTVFCLDLWPVGSDSGGLHRWLQSDRGGLRWLHR